ncbi:MAG: HEAT repeat domain-containing protein [Candidatus Freyarchaeota archaeon]
MNEGVELESVEGLVRRSKYGKEWRALVERLIRALRDENRYVRWGAAGALGELGDARAVQPLVEALKSHAELRRRRQSKKSWSVMGKGMLGDNQENISRESSTHKTH